MRIIKDSFRRNIIRGDDADDIDSDRERFLFVHDPYELRDSKKREETEFEAIVTGEAGEYRYGFSYDADRIVEEWLYFRSDDTGRESMLLERDKDSIDLGATVRAECKKYISSVRDDALVLTVFSHLHLDARVFAQAYAALRSINVLFNRPLRWSFNPRSLKGILEDAVQCEQLTNFLHSIDTGIVKIEGREEEGEERSYRSYKVYTFHKGEDGKLHRMSLGKESDGTLKVCSLFVRLKRASERGECILVDELDAQLHPLVLMRLVHLFYGEKTNGQLIYTSHDLTLLDKRYTRRDQIWFVEKDGFGISQLFSLAEFDSTGSGALDAAYLGGVFGGIPRLLDGDDD